MATDIMSAPHFRTPPCTPPIIENRRPKEAAALAAACASGDLEDAKRILGTYLLGTSPENYVLHKFWPTLLTALAENHTEIASYLLAKGVPFGLLGIQQAIETRSTAIFNVLLQHGWNINQALSETQPPALAFLVDDIDITTWFLDNGADPNASCRLDLTPMSFAVQRASLQTIHALFDRGADVSQGQLIHHAVERDDGVIEVLSLLLEKGASLNAKMYEQHRASWNLQCFKGLGTPLHSAVVLGKRDVVVFLLEAGADPDVRDSKGRLPVDCAMRYGHPELVELLLAR